MIIPFRPKESEVATDAVTEIQLETSEEATPLLKFILKHLRIIIGSLLILFFIIIGAGIWSWYTTQEEKKAQIELGYILIKPLSIEQLDALEQFEKRVPSSLQKGVLLQIASIAIELDQFKQAADAYSMVYTKDPTGAVGMLAGLNQADLLQKLGNWSEALDVLNSLEKVALSPIISSVYEAQGVCAEQLGEKSLAVTAYKKLVDELIATGTDATFYENRIAALDKN